MPHLERVGEEEEAPGDRHAHEDRRADLDLPARIAAVGGGARGDREKQERHPVRDDGEAGERGRMELLEHDPVADDVLDRVRHHERRRAGEVRAEYRLPQRDERKAAQASSSG